MAGPQGEESGSRLSCRLLHSGSLASITDVDCSPNGSHCGEEEASSRYELVFPRTGCFVKHLGRRRVVADPGSVIFFNRDESYRVSHPVAGGDRCTTFGYSRRLVEQAFGRTRNPGGGAGLAFPVTHCPIGKDVSLALHALRRRVLENRADGLEIDETCLELLGVIARRAQERLGVGRPHLRPATIQRRSSMVSATRLRLAHTFREGSPLESLATDVGCSPFHLIRIFREEMGTSVHRYRTLLRLREALERLAQGESDLTTLALDLGYSSHSHFTDSFRRTFGLPPSAYRQLSHAQVRRLSKFLEA